MKIRVLAYLYILFILAPFSAKGQMYVLTGSRQTSENVTIEIPVFVTDPTSGSFSTIEFANRFPSAGIVRESISINYPDMSRAIDTIAILWYLKPESYFQKGEVNIVLIGIASDSTKTFYIDNNNDKIFADNEDSFVFKPETEKRILEIKILGAYNKYTLLNPDYSPPLKAPSRTKEYYKAWHQSIKKPSLSVDFSLITGAGHTSLLFKPATGSISTYNYFAKITGSVKPSVGLDFSWFNLHILFSGSFERIQYDETARFSYSENITRPQRDYNCDPWMDLKLHAGVTAEYDLGLFRSFWVSPFGTYSVYKNIVDKTFDRRFPSPGAKYKELYSTEYGVKLKAPIAFRTVAYIKASYTRSYFDASEFIPEYIPGSYSLNYHQTYFGVGFLYRLFR